MPIRLSQLFLRTLREDPSDADVQGHRLLLRAGYIRRAAPGIYTWLPLGLLVKAKIEKIVREEMANAGSQEVFFPALLPREPFETKTGLLNLSYSLGMKQNEAFNFRESSKLHFGYVNYF